MNTKFAVVFAAALASFAGTAISADAPELKSEMVFSTDATYEKQAQTFDGIVDWNFVSGKTVFSNSALAHPSIEEGLEGLSSKLTIGGSADVMLKSTEAATGLNVFDFNMTGGTLTLEGSGSDDAHSARIGAYNSFTMTGGTINLGENSRLWLSTDNKEGYTATTEDVGMMLRGGTINMSGGTIKAGDGDDGDYLVLAGTNINAKVAASDDVEDSVEGKAGDEEAPAAEPTISTINATGVYQSAGKLTIEKGAQLNWTAPNEDDDAEGIDFDHVWEITGGEIVNDGTFTYDHEIRVAGNGVLTNHGLLSQNVAEDHVGEDYYLLVVEDGGVINTAFSTENFDATIKVGEGGTFNLLNLNSEKNEAGDYTQLLIHNGQHWTLDGGVLAVEGAAWTGAVKVGTASKAGTLHITGGDYAFESIALGKKGTLDVAGGNLSLGTLSFSDGKEDNAGAATVASGSTLNITKGLSVGATGTSVTVNGTLGLGNEAKYDVTGANAVKVEGGTLKAWANQIFKKTEAASQAEGDEAAEEPAPTYELTTSITNTQFTNNGFLEVQDQLTLTTEEIQGANQLFNTQGANLSFANLTVELTDAQKKDGIAFNKEYGTTMIGQTVVATAPVTGSTEATAIVDDATVGVGTIKVADTATSLKLTGESGTTYFSGSDQLFEGARLESVTVEGAAILGHTAESSGTVNVKNFSANSLTVTGAYTAQNVTTTTGATVNGSLSAMSLSGGEVTVNDGAQLAFDTTDANVTLQSGSVVAIGKYQAPVEEEEPVEEGDTGDGDAAEAGIALYSVTKPANGQVNSLIDASAADTLVTVGEGSEAAFKAALANYGIEYDEEINSGIYFADTLKLDTNGKVQVSTLQTVAANGEVAVGNNGIVVIKGDRFMNSTDFVVDGKARFGSGAQVVIDGLNSKGSINLSKSWGSDGTNVTFVDNNVLFNEELVENAADAKVNPNAAVIQVTTNAAAFDGDDELYGIVDTMLDPTADVGTRNVLTAIGRENGAFVQNGTFTEEGFNAIEEYLAMPVTAGTYNVAYDAAEQVTGTIQRRNLEPSTGLGVWADVFYTTNEAEKIYGGQGYSADIYGGTIGFDGTFSCGAKLGIALSVGSGDADSEKSVGKYSNDADFWGVSVYTGKDIAGLYFSADVSYLSLDNDIDGSIAGASVGESIDSSVFTVGLRADMTVYDQAFKVVPHFGIRYTNIDVDDYRGLDSDSMNVLELPIGVKVAGDFEPAAGWKLTPSFDFTVVPQIGDKDVSTIIGDVDVIDNLYNSTLGVNATYGNFAFGLSYRYGFGNDDRSNNAFQTRASYQF